MEDVEVRSPALMDIIQIDISNKCHLSCSHCTRLISHQSKKWEMDLPTFEAAVASMEGWNAPGKVLGIIAGEPTLNSNFEQLALSFAANWGGPLTTNGRDPIADLNAFAEERLFDRSNGRGLWTSLGPGFYKHAEVIFDVFSHFNTNTHETGGLHQAMLISRKDYIAQTGISDDEWLANRDRCFVQNLWSASINDKGAYPCEVMASIDRLFYGGKHAWPVEVGWWKRTPEEFGDMLELCNHCSLAQRCPSRVDSEDRDIISLENVRMLISAGSPAVQKNNYDLWQGEGERVVTTKDSYVGENRRVGVDHDSLRPKRLAMVVVSVGTGDILAKTLPVNAPMFDHVVVVTTTTDDKTIDIVHELQHQPQFSNGQLSLVMSDRCYEDNHAFNKGKMLNAGIALIKNPDWILCTDADVFLHRNFRDFIKTHALNPGCLYYTDRFDVRPGQTEEELSQQWPELSGEPNGYFQLWNRRSLAIRDRFPSVMFETFCSAAGVDSAFMQQWPEGKRVKIPEIPVIHVAHGDSLGHRWNGIEPKPRTWRMVGVLTAESSGIKLPDGTHVVELVDTAKGEVWQLQAFGAAGATVTVPVENGEIIFKDRPLGPCHVQVQALL